MGDEPPPDDATALQLAALPPGFPSRGVTVEALEELLLHPDFKRRWTTNEACILLVRPLTAPPGVRDVSTCTNAEQQWYAHEYVSDDAAAAPIAADGAANIPEQHIELRQASRSYCELLIEQGKAHQVGRAVIFVSHAWKYRLVDEVTALRAHVDKLKAVPDYDGREIYLWFDICSVNQHVGVSHLDGDWGTIFSDAIGAIGSVLLVLSPWDAPIPMTRVWCLWEIYCAIKTGAVFDVCIGEEERQRFLRSGLGAVQDAFAHIDSSKGEGGAEDKARITAAILRHIPGGFKGLDALLFAAMRDVLLRLRQEAAAEAQAAAGGALTTAEAVGAAFATVEQLKQQGRLEEAAALWLEVIAGYEALEGGPTGENTLAAKMKYAIVLNNQGKLEEAGMLYLEVIEGETAALGANHASTLLTKGNYAIVLQQQGNLEEAARIYWEAIEGFTAALGANHATTLLNKGGYAIVLKKQGKLEEAERVYREVIEGQTAALGAGHTSTLSTKYNLGNLLLNAGDMARARALLEEAAAGRAAALGEDHQDTQLARRRLARCVREERLVAPLVAAGIYSAASPWAKCGEGALAHKQTLELRAETPAGGLCADKSEGPTIGNKLLKAGRVDAAADIFAAALVNMSDASTQGSLALVRTVQGRFEEAQDLFAEAVKEMRDGELNSFTVLRSACRAAAVRQAGDEEEGTEETLRSALEFCNGRVWLGAEHPFTKWCAEELATDPLGELGDALTTTTDGDCPGRMEPPPPSAGYETSIGYGHLTGRIDASNNSVPVHLIPGPGAQPAVLLVLHDWRGWRDPAARALAARLAAEGYTTCIPDLFAGEAYVESGEAEEPAVAVDAAREELRSAARAGDMAAAMELASLIDMSDEPSADADLPDAAAERWAAERGLDAPRLLSALAQALQEGGAPALGAVGLGRWGGEQAVRLAARGGVLSAAVALGAGGTAPAALAELAAPALLIFAQGGADGRAAAALLEALPLLERGRAAFEELGGLAAAAAPAHAEVELLALSEGAVGDGPRFYAPGAEGGDDQPDEAVAQRVGEFFAEHIGELL